MNETTQTHTGVCEHGSLRRQCLLCEKDDEIAALKAEVELLEARELATSKTVDKTIAALRKRVEVAERILRRIWHHIDEVGGSVMIKEWCARYKDKAKGE